MLEIDDKIYSESEMTSTISSLSYGIENELYNGTKIKKINKNINVLREKGKILKNLTFIDVHLDKNTNKVIIVFAGRKR
ncbi:hypothetical protein [Macrococcus armenti]|uniref:hypothetical protein n=1 Tax=Macrococcus armenti TaxID=2875764 RepID=UPI001CCBC65E|nr:hypothetical protein [Macrococcus armenti]UBH14826.1 hypothetical protein LAU44_08610 [Macrococcus armenti]UBH17185.1 hypothetical protein LAU39_08640 [Macrococcus armenti]UBH19451.1 hypothetical protein LAU40_08620 [Macrococcus armenti]